MRVLVTACLLSIVICGVGRAAEPGADELITRGLELRRQAKPEQALEMFQRAHALAPSPRTFGQMGLVEASLEHWLDAETHLTGSLATPDDPWVRKNRAFLDQALKVSRGHIGELVVTGPAGTDVAVDGRHVGTLPAVQPVKLVQGNAVVTANSAGFNDFSKTVVIEGGARTSSGDRARPGRKAARGRAGGACATSSVVPAATVGDGTSRPYLEDGDGHWPRRSWCRTAGMGNHLDRRRPQRRLSDERRRLQQRL